MKKETIRCAWSENSTPIMLKYHDKEWGSPECDDNYLFEMLLLEGTQAGLSWNTILNKRENYRRAFDNFNVDKVAKYNSKKIDSLLQNKGLVRNKLKIASAIRNAKVFISIQKEFGSFDAYIWKFTNGKPIVNKRKQTSDIPSSTKLSNTISIDLKKRGMSFVGPTIVYAFMQSIGLVNDHITSCFRYSELKKFIHLLHPLDYNPQHEHV